MILPLSDERLWSQLGSRHYKSFKEAAITRLQLESKAAEVNSHGSRSPDRADAAVLAFTDVSVDQLHKLVDGYIEHEEVTDSKRMSKEDLAAKVDDMMYNGELEDSNLHRKSGLRAIGSLSSIIKSQARSYGKFSLKH